MQQESLFDRLRRICESLGELTHKQKIIESPELEGITTELNITKRQALFFVVVFDHVVKYSSGVALNELAEILEMSQLELYEYYGDFIKLEKHGLITIEARGGGDRISMTITPSVFTKIISGVISEDLNKKVRTFADLTDVVFKVMKHAVNDDHECNLRIRELGEIFEDAMHLEEVRWMSLNLNLDAQNMAILSYVSYKRIISDERTISTQTLLESLYGSAGDIVRQKRLFTQGKHELIQRKILSIEADFFFDGDCVALTDFGMDKLLNGYDTLKQDIDFKPKLLQVIKNEDILRKRLIFNQKNKEDLDRIHKLLKPKAYASYLSRAKEMGLSEGVTFLLYGLPGTGKTESVKQVAFETGRDILMVDISEIRDKYVGESEKRLNSLFKEYKRYNKNKKRKAILLFNEADALIGRRTKVTNSVDQMNNAMQNILLQQLEDFDGILFATTNLKISLDSAFDRRFLMKINFELPKGEQYKKLVNQKLKIAKPLREVVYGYQLSGGQLDVLLRNIEIKQLLGETIDKHYLDDLCKRENGSKRKTDKKQIGYQNLIYEKSTNQKKTDSRKFQTE